jgi:hypothetical protein
MKSLFINDGRSLRLDATDPTSVSEELFEEIVITTLRRFYPSCYTIPFKPVIQHNGEGWKPDLALIDKNFGYWFIIEVETASHSLQKHVLPQVRAFQEGIYGDAAIKSLSAALGVSYQKAGTIVEHVPRHIAVISNHEDVNWTKYLEAENIQHVSITAYCDDTSVSQVFHVTGVLKAAECCIGFGKVSADFIRVWAPSPFWQNGHSYRMSENSGTANWLCTIDDKGIWLTKKRGVMQQPDSSFVQFIQHEDQIVLKQIAGNLS